MAVGLELDGDMIKIARLALGGVAHKPWRDLEAEDFLERKPASEKNFARAARLLLRGARGFGYNDFKIELARRAVVRALRTAASLNRVP